ncbi:MAG: hypothetical protein EHM93_05910 [Bacteroidales bacterium]|nr:MAG: hypothetical protein EHM93_05910 [Bacteroidales bacterium]
MLERLKVTVEKKFEKKITSQKDCKALSVSILESSGEYISPATLRRVFGLLLTNSNPSRVTHDILCRYVGIEDWEHFVELNREAGSNRNQVTAVWSRISDRSRKISLNTLDTIKDRCGMGFNNAIERQFADERLNYFFSSECNSTALIGPGGYGKSTLLAKWFEKNISKRGYSNDVILFIQALALNSFANSETYFEDWLMRLLGLSSDYNLLIDFKSSNVNPPGKFILIIDGLDEANLHGSKLEKVYTSIANFSMKFSKVKWVKIVISTRLFAWNRFKPFVNSFDSWFHVDDESFSSDGANMPLLTSTEIQKILDNTIASSYDKRILLDELSLELKDTLSYPYFLQLFVAIFHPENEYLLNDQLELFREFLNKQIYNANYSEEKGDIINKILDLSDYGLNPDAVKKNTLKEFYPIHLKLAGNYFAAYEDLISFGIVVEDDVDNKFGGHCKVLRIANSNLFEILIAKSYLENEEDISITLFNRIEKKYKGHELLPNLIIRLYQFAYKGRVLKPLMNFFDLNSTTLKAVLSNPKIAITLRKDEYLRKHLLPIYASIPMARKYFFEDFPDLNSITGTFSVGIDYYLKHYDTPGEEIIGLIYNIYSGFLSLDEGRVERYYTQLKEFKPSVNLNSNIAGKWFACKLMYHYLLKSEEAEKVFNETVDYLKSIRLSKNYKYGSFESAFYFALVITNQYNALYELTEDDERKQLLTNRKELMLYRFIGLINSGKPLGIKDIIEIDLILSQLNPLDSFTYKIIGQVLKAVYYMNSNEMTNAYECYRNSTELSNLAGYKIIEVKLMKNLSNALLKLGEKSKSVECSNFAERLTKKTGFSYERF